MSKTVYLRLIYPASKDKQDTSPPQKIELKNGCLQFYRLKIPAASPWPHLSASLTDRLQELLEALENPDATAIICGRGGYGVSDLLPHIPWHTLKGREPKLIIGFSDISALHSGFFTQLGWPGLHAPMPSTNYWSEHPDLDLPFIYQALTEPEAVFHLKLEDINFGSNHSQSHQGWLYGGCLSVLTNLIGTPYFPRQLAGSILFWEDIDEPVGRIFRHVNQWLQSGSLKNVQAIVLGQFTLNQQRFNLESIAEEISQRTDLPVFTSLDFGHCSPNIPLMVGAQAEITNNQLIWKRSLQNGTLTT